MRPLEQLINNDEPGWKLVEEWIGDATNPVEVLPVNKEKRDEALLKTQVTTRSPMGAVVYETGGILVDHGFIRILGSGNNQKMQRSLPDWNLRATATKFLGEAGFVLIADDAIGGFFALDGSLGSLQNVFYLAPDTLAWECMNIGYSEFLLSLCFTGNLEGFYEGLRWSSWQDEVSKIHCDQVLSFYPPLWSNPPESPVRMPSEKRHRAPVPASEAFAMTLDLMAQLSQIPDQNQIK